MLPRDLMPNPEGLIVFAAHKAATSMTQHINSTLEKNFDITVGHWAILYRTFKNDYLEISTLPQKLLLPEEEINTIIDDLVSRNTIYRKNGNLQLKMRGKVLIFQIIPTLMGSIEIFRKDVHPEDMIIAVNVLNQIFHNLHPEEELYQLKTPPKYIEAEN